MYICFVLGLCLLAASPARSQSTPAFSGQKKVVVRADKRTGKLVSAVVPLKKPQPVAAPIEVSRIVEETAKANSVDPLLVHSVIQVESNYNPFAISPKGAQGLMQLMPATARDLGVRNAFDARQNIEAGVRYLKQLQDLYHDDRLALAAYNAGPGAVQKYKNVPPYRETQQYVDRVLSARDGQRYKEAGNAADATASAAVNDTTEIVAVVPTENKPPRLEQYVDEYGRLHLRTEPQ